MHFWECALYEVHIAVIWNGEWTSSSLDIVADKFFLGNERQRRQYNTACFQWGRERGVCFALKILFWMLVILDIFDRRFGTLTLPGLLMIACRHKPNLGQLFRAEKMDNLNDKLNVTYSDSVTPNDPPFTTTRYWYIFIHRSLFIYIYIYISTGSLHEGKQIVRGEGDVNRRLKLHSPSTRCAEHIIS